MSEPDWKVWYHAMHENKFNSCEGNDFERYVSKVLKAADPGFEDPNPVGGLGDEGCDGLSEDGRTFYACYGKSQKTIKGGRDAYIARKMEDDLQNAITHWQGFQTWCFITNAQFGPIATKKLMELRKHYGGSNTRTHLQILKWGCDELWAVLCDLDEWKLGRILPKMSHAQDADFEDIINAIEHIGNDDDVSTNTQNDPRIGEVSPLKMEYNHINNIDKVVFNEGRQRALEIQKWFNSQSDTTLCDTQAKLLHKRYEHICERYSDSAEILAKLYDYVGGTDFRYEHPRAMAVYAVVSFFFDRCDIFQNPYNDKLTEAGCPDAATD